MKSLNILFLSSEVVPFAKTGGLADVSSALPKALTRLNQNIKIIMPRYYIIDKNHLIKTPISLCVNLGGNEIWAGVYKTFLHNTDIEVFFIEYEDYYGRKGLYDENGTAYIDNAERFIFFSKAALILSEIIGFKPDIVHTNDWHAAPANIFLKTNLKGNSFFENTKSILTIHNLQHQGEFDKDVMNLLGIGWEYFTFDKLEKYGRLNLLKGGIYFADAITTVSPKYAKEIQTKEFGFGLEEHIKTHANKLFGILNGVDYDEWNPATDTHIKQNYDMDSLENKLICKQDLLEYFNLSVNETPVVSFIGRFAEQKGISLIASVFERMMQLDIKFIILGSGEKWAEDFFNRMQSIYKDKIAVYVGYNESLAHKIEAGADLFLMPSNFEPCGLNQIYSLRYGTVPIVRAVGGLDDTIENFNEKTNKGTGFKFYDAKKDALFNTINWAINTYHNKKVFAEIQKRGMSKRFDWSVSAKKYIDVYSKVLES